MAWRHQDPGQEAVRQDRIAQSAGSRGEKGVVQGEHARLRKDGVEEFTQYPRFVGDGKGFRDDCGDLCKHRRARGSALLRDRQG